MPPDDAARMMHMLQAAEKVLSLTRNRYRDDLDSDELLPLALARLLEIIGEAAARTTEATRSDHPAIPWPQIIGMRNRLIHGYDVIDSNVLWQTITVDLPPLIASLRKAVGSKRDTSGN